VVQQDAFEDVGQLPIALGHHRQRQWQFGRRQRVRGGGRPQRVEDSGQLEARRDVAAEPRQRLELLDEARRVAQVLAQEQQRVAEDEALLMAEGNERAAESV
jgi:hypothetical protein